MALSPIKVGGMTMPEDQADNTRDNRGDRVRPFQWKKGQSGNPGGRPTGKGISAELRDLLDEEHNGQRSAAILAETLLKGALKGSLPHLLNGPERDEYLKEAQAAMPPSAKGIDKDLYDSV